MPSGLAESPSSGGGSYGGGSSNGYNYGGGYYGDAYGVGVGSSEAVASNSNNGYNYGGSGPNGGYAWGGPYSWDSGGYSSGTLGTSSSGDLGSSYASAPPAPASSFSLAPISAPAYAPPPPPPSWKGITDIADVPADQAPPAPADENNLWSRIKKAGLNFAMSRVPGLATAKGLVDAGQALGAGDYGKAVGLAVGLGTGNNLAGGLANAGIDAAMGKDVSQGLKAGAENLGWSTGGALFGGALAGPLGAFAGREIANGIRNAVNRGEGSPAGPTHAGMGYDQQGMNQGLGQIFEKTYPTTINGNYFDPEGGLNMDNSIGYNVGGNNGYSFEQPTASTSWRPTGQQIGAGLAGLMQLYAMNQNNRNSQQANQMQQQQMQQLQALQQQMQNGPAPAAPRVHAPNLGNVSRRLDAMFGPNSAASQQLRTTLDRKDAAAGRRSQYGPREVQLLSELTRLRAQAEPGYMNAEIAAANAANQNAYNIYNTQMQERNRQYQNLLAASQLGMNANQNNYNNQIANQNRRLQNYAGLYGVGKDLGAYDWLASLFKD